MDLAEIRAAMDQLYTPTLKMVRKLLKEIDHLTQLCEEQGKEIEHIKGPRYDPISGCHSHAKYWYDAWGHLMNHDGVVGTSDKAPIHYAVGLLNQMEAALSQAREDVERYKRGEEKSLAWDAKCLRNLATLCGVSAPASDKILCLSAGATLRHIYRAVNDMFGKTEQLKASELEIINLRTALTQAQIGDCCKTPNYCDGECTCEICDPQGNIEYWKAYADEAEKDNDELKASADELFGKVEQLANRAETSEQREKGLREELRELTLNICSDSELYNENQDRPGVYHGLYVCSTYIDELCVLAGVGNYQQALDIVDREAALAAAGGGE